jgi:hypothetical protein
MSYLIAILIIVKSRSDTQGTLLVEGGDPHLPLTARMLALPVFGLRSTEPTSSMALGGGEHSHVGKFDIQL